MIAIRLGLATVGMSSVLLFAGPTIAQGASCTNVGIAKPTIGSGHMQSIGSTANCNVDWTTDVRPQYEDGGTWHTPPVCEAPHIAGCVLSNPADCTFFAAGFENFNDYWDSTHTAACNSTGDIDQSNLPGGGPLCAFNWRVHVILRKHSDGSMIQTQNSSQQNKTC
jgi:hypothetical protein